MQSTKQLCCHCQRERAQEKAIERKIVKASGARANVSVRVRGFAQERIRNIRAQFPLLIRC